MSDHKKTVGQRQHYIPASHIGAFSAVNNGRLRERQIWVMRDGKNEPFPTKAQSVGLQKGLYSLHAEPYLGEDFVDRAWGYVEKKLLSAIDSLEASDETFFDVIVWATVFVPFVAQLFSRGRDFHRRYLENMPQEVTLDLENSINQNRLAEFQMYRGLLLNASWKVHVNKSEVPLILNDIGHVPVFDNRTQRWGYAVPLNNWLMFSVFQTERPMVDILLYTIKGETGLKVELKRGELKNVALLNQEIARYAEHEIYGPTQRSVTDPWQSRMTEVRKSPGAGFLGPMSNQSLNYWLDQYENFLKFLQVDDETMNGAMGGYNFIRLPGFEGRPVVPRIMRRLD